MICHDVHVHVHVHVCDMMTLRRSADVVWRVPVAAVQRTAALPPAGVRQAVEDHQ